MNTEEQYQKAKEQTVDTIGAFIDKLMRREDLDYNTVVDSVAIAALAGAHAADNHKNGGTYLVQSLFEETGAK